MMAASGKNPVFTFPPKQNRHCRVVMASPSSHHRLFQKRCSHYQYDGRHARVPGCTRGLRPCDTFTAMRHERRFA